MHAAELVTPDRFEDGSPMLLAGLRRRHTFEGAEVGVADQWREFISRQRIPGQLGSSVYGVMCGADADGIEYMCAVEVDSFGALAPGTGRMRVPAQRYAVFRHPKESSRASTWQQILGWLAEGAYASAHKPDFERYPCAPDLSSELNGVEIWVGIVEKDAMSTGIKERP